MVIDSSKNCAALILHIVFGKRGQRVGICLKFNFCRSKFKVLIHASVVLSGAATIIETGEIKEILIQN